MQHMRAESGGGGLNVLSSSMGEAGSDTGGNARIPTGILRVSVCRTYITTTNMPTCRDGSLL